MAITDTAGNVFSQIYGAAQKDRAPIQQHVLPSAVTVAASTTKLVACWVVPSEPGKVKAVVKGARWIQGATAGTLGSGIVVNLLNSTNGNKNMGVITQTLLSLAEGAAVSDGVAVLASTTSDRSATTGTSPVTSTTEPDVNVLAGDVVKVQVVAAAGASATAGLVQIDYQWLDNF